MEFDFLGHPQLPYDGAPFHDTLPFPSTAPPLSHQFLPHIDSLALPTPAIFDANSSDSSAGTLPDPTAPRKPRTGRGRGRRLDQGRGEKPTRSYIQLITDAINAQGTGRATLAEIYNYLTENYQFFRTNYTGWKNSVRHNLSLNQCFMKVPKNPGVKMGKGHQWMLAAEAESTVSASAASANARRRQKMERKGVAAAEEMDRRRAAAAADGGDGGYLTIPHPDPQLYDEHYSAHAYEHPMEWPQPAYDPQMFYASADGFPNNGWNWMPAARLESPMISAVSVAPAVIPTADRPIESLEASSVLPPPVSVCAGRCCDEKPVAESADKRRNRENKRSPRNHSNSPPNAEAVGDPAVPKDSSPFAEKPEAGGERGFPTVSQFMAENPRLDRQNLQFVAEPNQIAETHQIVEPQYPGDRPIVDPSNPQFPTDQRDYPTDRPLYPMPDYTLPYYPIPLDFPPPSEVFDPAASTFAPIQLYSSGWMNTHSVAIHPYGVYGEFVGDNIIPADPIASPYQ